MNTHNWIVPDWPAPPQVRALITTRAGGASRSTYAGLNLGLHSGDDVEAVVRLAELRLRLGRIGEALIVVQYPLDDGMRLRRHNAHLVVLEVQTGFQPVDRVVVENHRL